MSIRLKVIAAVVGFLSLSGLLGELALQSQSRLGGLALGIYDGAFMGLNYITRAQIGFAHFADTHRTPEAMAADAKAPAALKIILDNLDIAIERATTPGARKSADDLRKRVASFGAAGADLTAALGDLDRTFTKVVQHYASDGLAVRDDAEAFVASARQVMLWCVTAALGFAALFGLMLERSIIPPLRRAVAIASAIADGRLDNPIDVRGRSEAARLLKALAALQSSIAQNLARIAALHAEDLARQQEADFVKHAALQEMAETVERETTGAVEQIRDRTSSMAGTAEAMTVSADRTATSAEKAAIAATEALQTIGAAAETAGRITGSIMDINVRVQNSADMIARAVEAGVETRTRIRELSDKVGLIGKVTDIIRDTAARTNMLALNATIEAARAGEAGRGFAVVASEVKQLASQTARSTEEISRHITEVQAATERSVLAVGNIETTIRQIEDVAASIASAMRDQGAATVEISRGMTDVTGAAEEIAMRVAEVSAEAKETGARATEVQQGTDLLQTLVSEVLRTVVRVVRTSNTVVDRREGVRLETNLPCSIAIDGLTVDGTMLDLSEGGARVAIDRDIRVGQPGVLECSALSLRVAFATVRQNKRELSVRFANDAETARLLNPALEQVSRAAAA